VIQRSGAKINTNKAQRMESGKEYSSRVLEISGTEQQRVTASEMVMEALGGQDPGESYGAGMDRGANDRGYAVGGSLQMQLEAPMTSQKVSLRVACPSDRALQAVKQDLPAITSHAGVDVSVERGFQGLPILKISGALTANALATYLIQERMAMA